jgi:glycosyltransferase involved in cell wall biosynthesis
MPRVSIITPTFNCGAFIERTLNSVMAQSFRDYEVIVVDDGSTDGTGELLAPWRDRINYFYQPNGGLAHARNVAVSRSRGALLAYLDSDDLWHPHKLQRQVEFMDSHPECGLVHTELTIIDDDDRIIMDRWYAGSGYVPARGTRLIDFINDNNMQVPSVMERRECYEEVGGFDERFRRLEDYLHWFRVVLLGRSVGYIDEPLALYRRRSGSLSRNQAAMHQALIDMFRVLVEEHGLRERLDEAAAAALQRRVDSARRGLPYHLRQQGREDLARRECWGLIRSAPYELAHYLELLKSCIPNSLVQRLRRPRTL